MEQVNTEAPICNFLRLTAAIFNGKFIHNRPIGEIYRHFGLDPPGTKRCRVCGEVLEETKSGQRYCPDCAKVPLVCGYCGRLFYVPRCEALIQREEMKRKFHSRSCRSLHRWHGGK